MARTSLLLDKEKSQARGFGIASAALLLAALLSPWKILAALIFFAPAATGWKLVFHGSTVISMSLSGARRLLFQTGVATVFPLALSWYFLKDATTVTASGILGHLTSPWFLLPLAIIASVSWAAAEQLDQEHPFRGFLIACTVLFVICFFGYHGIYSEFDDQSETSYTIIDKEAAAHAAASGKYFGQFLLYVAISSAAMLAKLRKRHA